ncbi:MAG: hypothetical protein ACREJU_08475 [Nitrospiraceae bacterium]
MESQARYLADFDSATAMLRALAGYLRGKDFPLLGTMPRWIAPGMKLAAGLVNAMPKPIQEQVYIWSGWSEAIAPRTLPLVDGERVAEWMASLYPRRAYPAAVVGSSNGAAVHLWAALGIPWLPQTFLVPVARSGVHPDEPQQDIEWALGRREEARLGAPGVGGCDEREGARPWEKSWSRPARGGRVETAKSRSWPVRGWAGEITSGAGGCDDRSWRAGVQGPADLILRHNPALQLHHMHDPVQDRLMIQQMSYFRLKRRTLGEAYERFLLESLQPGGTIVLMDCRLAWPTTRYGDRHVFQFGALGGATVEELQDGGPRVTDYLKRHGSHRTVWEPPPPDGQSPEAEWGLEPSLGEDVQRFARKHGFRVQRVVFEQPEDMSPLVADLYRWWNRYRGVQGHRLLVDSFILMEPYWTIRTGSVPFWMVFNKEPSFRALDAYLRRSDAFDEIYVMLFSHGVDSIGLVPIEQWRRLFGYARKHGDFLGVDEKAFPRDFAVFVRYYFDLRHKLDGHYPLPPALTLKQLDEFLRDTQGCYRVTWTHAS